MKFASLIFTTIVIGSFSCNHSNIKGLLENVNNIIESYPDSALLVLESVNSPEQLSRKEHAEFTLAYLKAKDKCYLDLAGDTTAANNLIDFYKDQRSNPTTGWAYYYAGRVFHDANKEEKASTYYIEASKYAPKASDSKLGIMANYYLAEFHAKQFAFKEALAAYQQALGYCGLTKERIFETILLSSVGYTFGLNQQIDSALIYFATFKGIPSGRILTLYGRWKGIVATQFYYDGKDSSGKPVEIPGLRSLKNLNGL